jgi:uncharacterized protein YgiM (DUF1202 family)
MKGIIATIVLLTATLGLGNAAIAQESESQPSGDISTLASGTYFAQGSMFSRSYRVVARRGDRLCIKIANGPPNPYEGIQNITISTIAQRNNQAIIAASNEELIVQGPQEFVIGRESDRGTGIWQLATAFDGDLSAGLGDCLTGVGKYAKTLRGPFITGMIYPSAPGQLVAKQVKARINVRKEPGEENAIAHYGLSGDKVQMLASRRDQAGKIWYQVKFESAAEGWVRGDFVRRSKP